MKTLFHFSLLSLMLLLVTGCISERSGGYQNFESIQAGVDPLPQQDLPQINQGLNNLALKRDQDTLETLAYWDKTSAKFAPYVNAAGNTESMLKDIEIFVQVYNDYPVDYRRAVLMELQGVKWPYGLRGWQDRLQVSTIKTPIESMTTQALAIQACPVWLEKLEKTRTAETVDTQALLQDWQGIFMGQLSDVHAFWLSVALAIEVQQAHLPKVRLGENDKFSESDLVTRYTFDLPLQSVQAEQVERVDSYFRNYPAYQHDRKRYKPVYGATPWRFRDQLLGIRTLWTAILYSQAQGNEWISEGSYQAGQNKVGETTIYNQKTWSCALGLPIWLPLPLYAQGDTYSYRVKNGMNEAPKEEGHLFALSPFYVSAKGNLFLEQQEPAKTDIMGIPLLYAEGSIVSEKGRESKMRCVLNGNIYIGGSLHLNENDPKTYLHGIGPLALPFACSYTDDDKDGYLYTSLWGMLWTTRQAKNDLAEYNGMFWGFLGWGWDTKGQPLWRVFGVPIPRVGAPRHW